MKLNVDAYLNSEWEKYCEEQGCDLTEDDLTLLGEHLKQVEEAKAKAEEYKTLYTIALVKSYTYCMEYDRYSGREVEKLGSMYLKQGYIDGFLAGVTHRLTGGNDGGD
jgi:hypothetical protein